jgi:hypothetical protein
LTIPCFGSGFRNPEPLKRSGERANSLVSNKAAGILGRCYETILSWGIAGVITAPAVLFAHAGIHLNPINFAASATVVLG